jgi:anti-anti-sigma factor
VAAPQFTTAVTFGTVTTVVVSGELDPATVPLLTASVEATVAQAGGRVVLDLGAVTFLDGAGLRGLHHLALLPTVTITGLRGPVRQFVERFGCNDELVPDRRPGPAF